METVFALATARGKSGVAVIRISGPEAMGICLALVGDCPDAGRFLYRPIKNQQGQILDHGLILAFRAPHSFTGEDVVEFQVHGSLAVIQAVEKAILDTGRARYAEAGEFTRRALVNSRMDLAQVEALGDLIEAETEQQRQFAQRQLDGEMRVLANELRQDLLRAAALVEVTIDFADEEVPVDVSPEVLEILGTVQQKIRSQIDGSFISERLRDGFEVVILGPPNAGKSTLLNRLAQRDVAITSEIAGTTRDTLEVRVDLNGMPVTFVDTAGLREAKDEIEKAGISRAMDRARQADLRVFLVEDLNAARSSLMQPDDLLYVSKADLHKSKQGISGVTGQGVSMMLEEVSAHMSEKLSKASTLSRERHRAAMAEADAELDVARSLLLRGDGDEFVASHIRGAHAALGGLVGAVDVEAVLGTIFSQFCIGK